VHKAGFVSQQRFLPGGSNRLEHHAYAGRESIAKKLFTHPNCLVG
jgi:hypothetical protein